jgi:DNA-binding transcriptional ArsR family regulator
MKKELIDIEEVAKAASLLRAINHKLRRKILDLLDTKKDLSVTDLYVTLHIEQSVCSQHLRILRKEGIIAKKPAGKHIYYHINYGRLEEIKVFTQALTEKKALL